MTSRGHYDRADMANALSAVGVRQGDVVMSHVGLGMLGFADGERSIDHAADTVIDAFLDVLGPTGTWVVPTYSYTFTKGEPFDPATTPSDVGPFTERFRSRPDVRRSEDPLFSVAAVGPHAADLLDDLPHDCFGPDSVYGRLRRAGASIVNVGVGFRYATLIHHIEQECAVPYRYSKYFIGTSLAGGAPHEECWHYYVRPLDERGALPDLRRAERDAERRGLIRRATVGYGELTAIGCRVMFSVCADGAAVDPWFMSAAGADDWRGGRPAVVPEVDDVGRPLVVRIGADRV